jgi:hypothetical protein
MLAADAAATPKPVATVSAAALSRTRFIKSSYARETAFLLARPAERRFLPIGPRNEAGPLTQ